MPFVACIVQLHMFSKASNWLVTNLQSYLKYLRSFRCRDTAHKELKKAHTFMYTNAVHHMMGPILFLTALNNDKPRGGGIHYIVMKTLCICRNCSPFRHVGHFFCTLTASRRHFSQKTCLQATHYFMLTPIIDRDQPGGRQMLKESLHSSQSQGGVARLSISTLEIEMLN